MGAFGAVQLTDALFIEVTHVLECFNKLNSTWATSISWGEIARTPLEPTRILDVTLMFLHKVFINFQHNDFFGRKWQ